MATPFHPDAILGTTLAGRFRLVSHLASGGTSAVFRAEDVASGRLAAVKVLRPEHASSPDVVARFRREAQIARSVAHPNVVRVHEVGQTPQGLHFMAMELLEGESLFERLRREGHLRPAEAVPVLVQICAGLAAAHERGVVHRDLKPENVFLHASGDGSVQVKLVDFGIAQVEGQAAPGEAGMVVGTPEYLSPEQAQGRPVDPRADLYSVGVVAWRMLAGRLPFPVSSTHRLLEKHAGEPLPPLQLARPELAAYPALTAAVARACEKSRGRRPYSAAELARELLAAVPAHRWNTAGRGDADPPPPPFPSDGSRTVSAITPLEPVPPPRTARPRRRVLVAAGGLLFLVILALGLVLALRG